MKLSRDRRDRLEAHDVLARLLEVRVGSQPVSLGDTRPGRCNNVAPFASAPRGGRL